MPRALGKMFFSGSALEIAPALLGQFLCIRNGTTITRLRISETEAYDGPHDKACHGHRGLTRRTSVMFGPGGVWYVYLCYGVHWLLNVVTGPADYPAAVLIRGAGSLSGPGRLTRHLGIDQRFNGLPATRTTGLWMESHPDPVSDAQITTSPRIGLSRHAAEYRDKPWRWLWTPRDID